ncbi:MAG TPA: lipid A deacylase LpxR family protein [Flavobacterium sp.]|nr:lipid A deacylase LpxR family protein [Flavobacterium sp.]
MLRKIIAVSFLVFAPALFSQRHSWELGIIIDNDLFASTVNDKYYTNGIEFFYRRLNKKENSGTAKEIAEFRFGQYIFNPHTVEAKAIAKHDRPFAGYLFASAGIHNFYHNEAVFKLSGQVGMVGPASGAEEFQTLFHRTFGYKEVQGWEFQIRNALAIQAKVFYSRKIAASIPHQNIDLHLKGEANIGTVLTGITAGPLARFSLMPLLPVYDSNLYSASLQYEKQKYKEQREFYFYINPNINYQAYDATIEGSLFSNESPVTYGLRPLRFYGEAGLKYRQNHWNFHYLFIYRSKEVSNPKNKGYFFGSLGASYLFY